MARLQEVAAANIWHGWGLDNNTLCPSTQISTTQELLCEPGYSGGIDQASQSWTGVTCTPNGHVMCLSLPGYNLIGNVSLLLELAPLESMQFLNMANNSLTGLSLMQFPTTAESSAVTQNSFGGACSINMCNCFCRQLAIQLIFGLP